MKQKYYLTKPSSLLICFQYNVDRWPTFKLFRQGRPYEYVGPMDKDNMILYMKEQEKSPSDEKTTYTGDTSGSQISIGRLSIMEINQQLISWQCKSK